VVLEVLMAAQYPPKRPEDIPTAQRSTQTAIHALHPDVKCVAEPDGLGGWQYAMRCHTHPGQWRVVVTSQAQAATEWADHASAFPHG
jgi:hypothetical protein